MYIYHIEQAQSYLRGLVYISIIPLPLTLIHDGGRTMLVPIIIIAGAIAAFFVLDDGGSEDERY